MMKEFWYKIKKFFHYHFCFGCYYDKDGVFNMYILDFSKLFRKKE